MMLSCASFHRREYRQCTVPNGRASWSITFSNTKEHGAGGCSPIRLVVFDCRSLEARATFMWPSNRSVRPLVGCWGCSRDCFAADDAQWKATAETTFRETPTRSCTVPEGLLVAGLKNHTPLRSTVGGLLNAFLSRCRARLTCDGSLSRLRGLSLLG